MRGKHIKREGDTIVRLFSVSDLLDEPSAIRSRIQIINALPFDEFEALPATCLTWLSDTVLEYRQAYVLPEKPNSLDDKTPFLALVATLDYLQSIDFVHGDVNAKNLIYSSNRFHLIDFEPSFYRIKLGQRALMATRPYLARLDREQGIVSSRTDKLGFFYFVLRMRGKFDASDRNRLTHTMDHSAYLGFDENELDSTTFGELLDRAW